MSDVGRLREALAASEEGAAPLMLAAVAYTPAEVLAWELRHLYAGTRTCRLGELLPGGGASTRHFGGLPYHAGTYDLAGRVVAAPGFRDVPGFDPAAHGLVELPVTVWSGWVFGHGRLPLGHRDLVPFDRHVGDRAGIVAP